MRIDYSHMLAPGVHGAITDKLWKRGAERFAAAHREVETLRGRGTLGFLELPGRDRLEPLLAFAGGVGQAFSDIVILGIGGSALGTIALRSALRSPWWNALGDEARSYFPRLHVVENVDPVTIAALLDRIDLSRSLFIVISKSGGTAETMAQYLIVRERLMTAIGKHYHRHLVFITDPEKGALRKIAGTEPMASFAIPPNVGGRFSVLTSVGLLPAALIGIDVPAILEGAEEMRQLCLRATLEDNPAAVFATAQWLADSELGLCNHVMMPYADALRDFSAWFVQLWAESLGKVRRAGGGAGRGAGGAGGAGGGGGAEEAGEGAAGEAESVGPTPIAALGATDQHSQLQLFMEGPRDKTVTFIVIRDSQVDVPIPHLHSDIPELAYLGGHTLKELLDAEQLATASALARAGRPSMKIELERIDAWHVGALIMFFEVATVFAGALYGIDPLDQPGVELGKRFTYALLGRPEAEMARRAWEAVPRVEPRWVG